ncbi:hypothetical protein KR100_13475 [Synechococcus sp. KORDI-100]|nr:hypothetical protein KR100_13475 [Synechococcus sp. KORDI-100]
MGAPGMTVAGQHRIIHPWHSSDIAAERLQPDST